MRFFFFLVCVFVVSMNTSVSGEEFTISQILKSASDDRLVNTQEQKRKFLKQDFPGVPLIDDIEFKFEQTSFDFDDMEYSIRLKPRGFGETAAALKYRKAVMSKSDQKIKLLQRIAVLNRYLLVIDLLEYQVKHELYVKLMDVYADMIKVMEKQSNLVDSDFEIQDLISVENDNIKAQASDMEAIKSHDSCFHKVCQYLKDTTFTGIDTTGLISIDTLLSQVEKMLANKELQFDTNNVYLENLRLNLDIEEKQYKLEQAESRKYFGYLGFAYDNGERRDQIDKKRDGKYYNMKEPFSIEMGISLPFLTDSPHKIIKRKSDYLTAGDDYETVKSELIDDMNENLGDLKNYISQYRFLKAREQEVDAEASLQKYLKYKGVDPLVLLSIKENIIKNQINRSEVKYGFYRNYIKVLDVTGEMSRCPNKNFLLEK